MKPRAAVLGVAALMIATRSLSADSQAAITAAFAKDGTRIVVKSTNIHDSGTTLVSAQSPLSLALTCTDGADCTKVKISFNQKDVPAPEHAEGGTVTLPSEGLTLAGNKLMIAYEGVKLATQVQLGAAGTPASTTVPSGTIGKDDLGKLLQSECPLQKPPDTLSQCAGKCHPVIVRPTGKLLSPKPILAEDETLRVYILADSRLATFLDVRRKSALRNVDTVSLVGSSLAQAGAEPSACTYQVFDLTDFAPGSGDIEIVFPVDAGLMTVGTFSIRVDRLYSGKLSFGAVYSGVGEKTFKLVPTTGMDKQIVAADSGDRQLLYAVFLTPFVHGKRTLTQEESLSFKERFNPTVGLSINNLSDHLLTGFSIDYPWVVIAAGLHLARVSDLPKKSGLREGSSFTGMAADLPTEKHWKAGGFVSLSLDLRIATQLLKAVSGVGK